MSRWWIIKFPPHKCPHLCLEKIPAEVIPSKRPSKIPKLSWQRTKFRANEALNGSGWWYSTVGCGWHGRGVKQLVAEDLMWGAECRRWRGSLQRHRLYNRAFKQHCKVKKSLEIKYILIRSISGVSQASFTAVSSTYIWQSLHSHSVRRKQKIFFKISFQMLLC